MQSSAIESFGETNEITNLASIEQVRTSNVPGQSTGEQKPNAEPEVIGKYRVTRKLGSGGMGTVYLAINTDDMSKVAIKVLPENLNSDSNLTDRFQKEARLLSEINHPHVTNLCEVGEHDQKLFMAMEYVPGLDLKQLLDSQKRLPEKSALRIVRDIADALSSAHSKGIIHRDIKPANILLAGADTREVSSTESLKNTIERGEHPCVKLTDFGLARHIDQSESLAMTKTGAVLGTPYYLAPEQCMDTAPIRPATDIYSLGVTLFIMLSGRRPFLADDAVKLITMHCFEEAPDLKKIVPEVSDAVANLVERCLRKVPEERFIDGEHLRDEIDRILRGDLKATPSHPIVPETDKKVIEANWEWNLSCSVEELWPYVSNTERVNNAIGLPPVEYTTHRDEHGAILKSGSFRLGWAKLEWQEHPFEWVEGKRLGVIREFKSGPFDWFSSVVQLHSLPKGRTRLVHQVKIAPRGYLGQMLAFLEVNYKGRKKLDEIYPRIDQVISQQSQRKDHVDPFVSAMQVQKRIQSRLTNRISQILEFGTDRDCVSALQRFLLSAPAQELARIRPFALADSYECDRAKMTEASLHACKQGLLQLHWDILCPTCRISTCVRDTLSDIKKHEFCEACDLDFEVDFQNAIELIFRVHPEIRKTNLKTYCIGGPEHSPHVVSQMKFQPGETLELDLALASGNYLIRGPQLPYTIPVVIKSDATEFTVLQKLSSDCDNTYPIHLSPERQRIILKNEYQIPILLRIERTIRRDDVLTAADASRIDLFRQFFPEQVASGQQLMNYSTCTILGIQITDIEDLYAVSGDGGALQRIEAEMNFLRQIAELHNGELSKEQEDRILIVFQETGQAIKLAEKLLARSSNAEDSLPLGLVLHRGNALAKTQNGKLDFFGRAVSAAGTLLRNVPGHALKLSDECYRDGDIREALFESGFTAGIDESLFLYSPQQRQYQEEKNLSELSSQKPTEGNSNA